MYRVQNDSTLKSLAELQRYGSRLFPFCPSLPAIENSPPGSPTTSYMSGTLPGSIELLDANNNRSDRLMELEQTISNMNDQQALQNLQQLWMASTNAAMQAASLQNPLALNAVTLGNLSLLSQSAFAVPNRPLSKTLNRTQSAPLSLDLAIAAANAVAAANAAAAAANVAGPTSDITTGPSTTATAATTATNANSTNAYPFVATNSANKPTAMDTQSLVKQRIRQTVLTRTASKQKLRQESVDEESELHSSNPNCKLMLIKKIKHFL